MHFGEYLKTLRNGANKSQVEMVQDLQGRFPNLRMSQSTISALELRETPPRGDVLECLAQYFGIPAKRFYEDDRHDLEQVKRYILVLRLHTPHSTSRFAASLLTTQELEEKLNEQSKIHQIRKHHRRMGRTY